MDGIPTYWRSIVLQLFTQCSGGYMNSVEEQWCPGYSLAYALLTFNYIIPSTSAIQSITVGYMIQQQL